MKRYVIPLALWLMFSAAPAHAIYRCEINGKIEYRDHPCPAGKAQEVKVNPMTPTPLDHYRAVTRAARDKEEISRIEAERAIAHEQRLIQYRENLRANARAAENAERQGVRCDQMARNKSWTQQTAKKYAGDAWWQNQAKSSQENYDLDCR